MNVYEIIEKAEAAGNAALKAASPEPMIVMQEIGPNPGKMDYVPDGACGFAWVKITCTSTPNRKFVSELKKAGLCEVTGGIRRPSLNAFSKSHGGGYDRWVFEGNQSITRKEAFADAYVKVLQSYGIKAERGSRLD